MTPALLLLAAAAAPQPGELRLHRDWIVGCDNGRACRAVALLPEAGLEGATLALSRGPAADAPVELLVTVRSADGAALAPAFLAIDARPFALAPDQATGSRRARDGATAARLLGRATTIAVLDGGRRVMATASARGSAAALLFMDEQQGRVGTAGALVRRGAATRVPSAPPLPLIAVPRAGRAAPRALSAARVRALLGREATLCDHAQPLEVEAARLDARTSLALAAHPCGNGAYNIMSTALLVDERGLGRRAGFEAPGAAADDREPLVNADWDPATRRLSTFARGRGLGDCGVIQRYAWDGARFRLVERSEMTECRGSTDYITTWRARTAER